MITRGVPGPDQVNAGNTTRKGPTRLQLALMGKGQVAAIRMIACSPWRGPGEGR